MKKPIAFLFSLGIFGVVAMTAQATEFSTGTVMKLDLKAKKVTVDHGELKNLEMPAMTMVFRTLDDDMITKLAEGQKIEFIAERVNGKLTITQLKQ